MIQQQNTLALTAHTILHVAHPPCNFKSSRSSTDQFIKQNVILKYIFAIFHE